MGLSAAQIGQFHAHGYTTAPGFFSRREVSALRAEVERFKREGLLRNVATVGDGKTHSQTQENLQLIPLFDKSTLLRALPFESRVLEAVSALIGDPAILHLDQLFLKPGRHGAGTSWHQDNAYFKIRDPLKGTAFWVAVHDATVANGTIHVIPDSFRQPLEHTRDPYSDHHIRCYPPEEQATALELEAGGVAFFCYGTAHCTKANQTDHERAGLAFHFLRSDYMEENKFHRTQLTGPEASGGLREYGVDVRGTWDAEVDRVLDGRLTPPP
jgi:phytanoyl-CoA hydroxylase